MSGMTPMEELKYHFCSAMSKLSTRGKEMIETTWEKNLVPQYNRPYHNLDLIYKELDTARILKTNITPHVIVAAILHYARFEPKAINNLKRAKTYADFLLNNPFGWANNDINSVINLMFGHSMLVVSESARPEFKLMHDMKMSRLAKSTMDFIADRKNARKEYSHLSQERFFNAELALLTNYDPNHLFALRSFNELIPAAKRNISGRIEALGELISTLQKKSS
jgi:predicted metal-dependent HD superfamily phosphohydrolase